MIKFHIKWWLDTSRLIQGMPIHPLDPNAFLYILLVGRLIATPYQYTGNNGHSLDTNHFILGMPIHPLDPSSFLYILLVRRPILTPYQYTGNNGHSFALKKALKYIHHSCVMISTDNTTVVSYINKQGGTHSPNLCVEVWKILSWCLQQYIVIRVHHIPGRFNVLADRLSKLDKLSKQNGHWIN